MAKKLDKLVPGLAVMMWLLWGTEAYAEQLEDPTRPPMATVTQSPAADAAAGPVDQGPVLQSVKISRARKMAIISGQEYVLGDMVGEAKLVAVRDHEVDLRSSDGTVQHLRMYSSVNKTVRKTKTKSTGARRDE